MAIDTATRRFSMMSTILDTPMVVPDGTIDQGDRQTFLLCYSGILWSAGGAATSGISADIWVFIDA